MAGSGLAAAWPLGLIVSLFFLWGAANSLNDVLIKQFTKAFTLRDWEAGLVQSAFYVGYFFGGLPAAKVAREYGYRPAVIVGLCLFALGSFLFYPVSRGESSYLGFLACLYLIAFGLAFLESSANPWVKLLGDAHREGFGTVALNVAQAFNPAGSILSVLCGRLFILDGKERPKESDAAALRAFRVAETDLVGLPYLIMGAIVALVTVAFAVTRFPALPRREEGKLTLRALLAAGGRLGRNAPFLQGVLAQFFYVAAQVSVWSFVIRYVQQNMPGTSEQAAADFIVVSLGLFVLGRFIASGLLCFVQECQLLVAFAGLAGLCCVLASRLGGWGGVAAVCGTSVFMSMMYPTIFSLAIAELDEESREVGASVVVMAIVGGAVAPPVMGAVSDAASIELAYLVPAHCFAAVAVYALLAARRRRGKQEVAKEGTEGSSPSTYGRVHQESDGL